MFVIQYLSVKGNVDAYRDVWGTGHEFDPVWTDADGMSFTEESRARTALSGILARNPDFPRHEWRVVKRTITETVCD